MKSDLSKRITDLLKAADALAGEYEADPFGAEVIEAHGSITAAQALLAEASKEPDSLSPAEIVAMRQDGATALEAAKIAHRRADVKRSQYFELMSDKLNELKGDAEPLVREARTEFQERIKAAVLELADGYFGEERGYGTPQAIATHRSRSLAAHERIFNGRYASGSFTDTLHGIRKALEACLQHLA